MTVIVIAEARGQTEAGYDGMLQVLADELRHASGFVLHSAFQSEGQWRVIEVWRSKADSDRFFAKRVAPNLPPGVHPKRAVYEAHSLVTAPQAGSAPREEAA